MMRDMLSEYRFTLQSLLIIYWQLNLANLTYEILQIINISLTDKTILIEFF